MRAEDLRLPETEGRVRLGVSACLLGAEVRYDGSHKRDRYLLGRLSPRVDWVPVCPELEAGMGTPREPVRLVRRAGALALLGTRSGADWTAPMEAATRERLARLGELDGYVFKRGSPSCGLFRVKVYPERGQVPASDGAGLFAAAFRAANPLVPCEEEGRLHDVVLRDLFLERVWARRRLRDFLARAPGARDLVAFHTAHRLQLLAHDPAAHRRLGQLVASAGAAADLGAVLSRYAEELTAALARPVTPGRHRNVLLHLVGAFRASVPREERAAVLEVVDDYLQGLVELVAPLTLVRHLARRLGDRWVAAQTYLAPFPRELVPHGGVG